MPQDQDRPVTLEEFEEQRRKYYGIPTGLAASLRQQESGGKQYDQSGGVLTSPKQAKGRYQVLQSTADKYGLNASDPFENVEAGFRYLSDLNKQVDPKVADPGERWAQTLAGYHAGEGRLQDVNKTGNLPSTSDGKIRTDQYVSSIMNRWQQYDQERSGQQPSASKPATKPAPQPARQPTTVLPTQRQSFNRPLSLDESLRQSAQTNRGSVVRGEDIFPRQDVDPRAYAQNAKRQAFEKKPMLQRGYERFRDTIAEGGGELSKDARQTAGVVVGGARRLVNPQASFQVEDFPRWRQYEDQRNAELATNRASRPRSFVTDVAEDIIRAAPVASAALVGGELGIPAPLVGGGLSAAGADWSDPRRALTQTAIGTAAPLVGGAIGSRIGGPVGEIVGGGAGNVIGSGAEQLGFEGRLNPRELLKSGLIGAALSAPGAVSAARRPLSEPTPKLPQSRTPEGAIIAPESPLANRKLLPPGRSEDVPTEQLSPRTRPIVYPDAQTTQESPALGQWMQAENAPTGELPVVRRTAELPRAPIQEPTNRISEGAGAPLQRYSRPLEGQPVEIPQRQTSEFPETFTPGRKVTQETQVPGGLKPTESHASREDARQGYFERFDDQELVDEIRRMEDIRNQGIRGKSKLSPADLEANNYDLKIATNMQKERRRLQQQIGIEPGERIAPRTPGRQIQHSQFGSVTEAPDQAGVAKGKLRVVDTDGGEHTIQNPRTRGNQNAAFVKSSAIPAEAMPEMRARPKAETPISPRGQNYAIPSEAMPELRGRSKGTVLGAGLGGLQPLFERAPKPKPGQQDLFNGARREPANNAGLGSAVGGAFRTASQAVRTFKTAFDLSAPMSQGAFLTRSHPLKGAQAFGKMMRSLSKSQSQQIDQEILNHPLRKLGEENGLYLATGNEHPEEAFMLGKLNRAPGLSHSERTYRTYLDSLRLSVWDSYVKSLQASNAGPKAYKQAAEFINIATGRGSLRPGGKLANAMALGGDILFAPRNLAAKFQLLDPTRYARLEPGARKIVLRDAMTSFGSILGTAALLRAAGVKIGVDPRDDDFLEARWGNHRYDLTAGLKTEVKFLAKMAAGTYNQFSGEGNLPNQDPLSVAKNYARGKLAPGPGMIYDALKGSDVKGEKFSDKSKTDIALSFGPMIAEDLREGYKDSGVSGMLKSTPSIIGQRVSVRPDRAKAAFIDVPDSLRTEQKKSGETRSFLTPKQGRGPGEQDETPAAFAGRKARADEWSNTYGPQLVESPAYKSATPEIQQAAREYLKKTIADQTNEKRPSLYLFRPASILSTVKESAREKRRKAARQ